MAIAAQQNPTVGSGPTKSGIRSSAVVWVSSRRALLARMDDPDCVSILGIERARGSESSYLAAVVDAIGDRQRVMILGTGSAPLALEREYVAIYRRPDRLVEVEAVGPVDEAELVERVRKLEG